jgi:hypothetical protein
MAKKLNNKLTTELTNRIIASPHLSRHYKKLYIFILCSIHKKSSNDYITPDREHSVLHNRMQSIYAAERKIAKNEGF